MTNYERKINLHKHLDKKTWKARKAMMNSTVAGSDLDASESTMAKSPVGDTNGSFDDPTAVSSITSVGENDTTVEKTTDTAQSSSDSLPSQKRLREDDNVGNSHQKNPDSKKLCLDANASDESSENTSGDSNSSPSRSFYHETWADCFSQRSRSDKDSASSDDQCRQQTLWNKNSVQFPDIASQQVMSLVVPDAKLLPSNISICEDSKDLLVVDCEHYRLKVC